MPSEVLTSAEAEVATQVGLADVILLGTVTSTEETYWLGPYLNELGTVWEVDVTRELKGRVASGRIRVWDEEGWEGVPAVGTRVLLVASPKVLHLGRGTRSLFPGRPAYGDLVVPAIEGSLYWEHEDGSVYGRWVPRWAPDTFDGWIALVEEAAQAGEPGIELPGLVDEGGAQ